MNTLKLLLKMFHFVKLCVIWILIKLLLMILTVHQTEMNDHIGRLCDLCGLHIPWLQAHRSKWGFVLAYFLPRSASPVVLNLLDLWTGMTGMEPVCGLVPMGRLSL